MTIDTRNPSDPRRFARGYPDDDERRLEELFARSQKVQDLPAQLALVDTRVVVLEVSDPILKARVTALEAAPPDTLATGIFRSSTGYQSCWASVTSTSAAGFIFTFPQPFLISPVVTSTPVNSAATLLSVELFALSSTQVEVRVWKWDAAFYVFALVSGSATVHIAAVGQWK